MSGDQNDIPCFELTIKKRQCTLPPFGATYTDNNVGKGARKRDVAGLVLLLQLPHLSGI
jgi:hypothetical protein